MSNNDPSQDENKTIISVSEDLWLGEECYYRIECVKTDPEDSSLIGIFEDGKTEEIAYENLKERIVKHYSGKIKKEDIEFVCVKYDTVNYW